MFQQYKRRLAKGAVCAALLLLASAGCSRSSNTGAASTSTGSGTLDGGLGSSSLGSGTSVPLDSSSSASLALPTPAPVTAEQQACLTSNTALSTGFGVRAADAGSSTPTSGGTFTNGYSTTGQTSATTTSGATTTAALACYNGTSSIQPSQIYDAGLASLQFMGQCYQQVAGYQPSATATAAEISQVFAAAQQKMIECYNGILQQQMQFANWNAAQQQNYATQNQALFVLLSILQAQK